MSPAPLTSAGTTSGSQPLLVRQDRIGDVRWEQAADVVGILAAVAGQMHLVAIDSHRG